MNLKQRLKDWADAQATDCSLDLEALEQILTRKLSTDAAYVLGEEAFRAGFKEGWERAHCNGGLNVSLKEENLAWSDFEPSENVKGLIG